MRQGENDLQHLTSTIAGKIGEGVQKTESFLSSTCIYMVPEKLYKLKESAYTSHLIAIGPPSLRRQTPPNTLATRQNELHELPTLSTDRRNGGPAGISNAEKVHGSTGMFSGNEDIDRRCKETLRNRSYTG
ncbi:hypothetical protein RHGRI_015468 [Rhododendron griersonianum]|uniref:Uncharacterized protein n=1 Tax=Rhododendron griersonianum TaxID=479676 RepID=A0AAV6KDY9_9ERIC|nr:hypothetical protein RHGRI_015468 [Rhododendron griersonianum]